MTAARVLSFHAEALLLIHDHPEWTVAEIAQHLGCSKAKLYRDAVINRALQGRNADIAWSPSLWQRFLHNLMRTLGALDDLTTQQAMHARTRSTP